MRRNETPLDVLRVFSCEEAAHVIGVHRQTVHRWIQGGRLRAFDIGTPGRRRLRITEADLRDFIEANRLGGGSAA